MQTDDSLAYGSVVPARAHKTWTYETDLASGDGGTSLGRTHAHQLAASVADLHGPSDEGFPRHERLLRRADVRFVGGLDSSGLVTNTTYVNDVQAGDILTDACSEADGYRFHDCLHLSFSFVLGWSPVTRALLGRKRRSDPFVDVTQDGGRAIAVEEGVAALVFAHHAAGSLFTRNVPLWSAAAFSDVNPQVLGAATIMVAPFEVAGRTKGQWAASIVTGLRAMDAAIQARGDVAMSFDVDANEWSITAAKAVVSL